MDKKKIRVIAVTAGIILMIAVLVVILVHITSCSRREKNITNETTLADINYNEKDFCRNRREGINTFRRN